MAATVPLQTDYRQDIFTAFLALPKQGTGNGHLSDALR